MQHGFLIWILAIQAGLGFDSEWRRLSDGKGGGVNARAVALLDEGKILLENEAGKQFETPLEYLSRPDREFFLGWQDEWKKRAAIGAKLNGVIGQPVFRDSWRLWDEKVADVAARLQWPRESSTPYSSSYRRYTRSNYRFLGARPFSVVAYGDDRGQTSGLSLVFANKGDSFSAAGMGEDHFERGESATTEELFEDMLKRDAEILAESLSEVLGEGERQRFGEGGDRRTVERWDWNHHSFILSHEDDEYVGLLIVSTEEADESGRTGRISDFEMQARLESSVVREDQGDVYVKNIPMVNQGPKGYCVPATFERAMRYLGIPADMYLLAVAGGTAPGGGTNTRRLFEEVRSACYRKGRRPKDMSLDPLRMRDIKKYVDQGVPIMWQMCSLSEYNQIANRRTRDRRSIKDWAAYSARIAQEAEINAEEMENVKANFHVCMIIGYNEVTNEVAVSDSWGAAYELRWVHLEEAAAVTNGNGFVILR
ncbi:MAG: C39 family peptidase [Verrucomicrobiota bacterium JB023]|nr:C39 family peptidase [Verrucomicrobiota bacterium JB023]